MRQDAKAREHQLLEERAAIVADELRNDIVLQRQLAESREAEDRGEQGISAREFFAQRGRKRL